MRAGPDGSIVRETLLRARAGALALLVLFLGLWLPSAPGGAAEPAAQALGGPTFSFGAAGDFGYNAATVATFAAAGNEGLDFFLALGDTTYGDINETTWCNAFQAKVPHVLVEAGNHDVGENPGANLTSLLAACPYTLNETVTGSYAHEWYFDYPQGSPLVRFVLTGCGLSFVSEGGGTWTCAQGDSHYSFVADAIDAARTAGIPWVIVGSHKNCISAATKTCEIGSAFFSMLLSKRVDLILQGHEHIYERSKQLACAPPNTFVASCVADDGSAGAFRKGDGSVVAVAGTGGKSFYGYNPSDAEAPYFAAATDSASGFLRVDVNESVLAARFVWSAGTGFNDSFMIADPPLLSVAEPADGSVVTNAVVNVSGTTEPDAIVNVNGARADVAPDGTFSIAVPLFPGPNTVTVTSRQEWGTSATWTANVTFDDPAVHLQEELDAALAAAAAAEAQVASATENLSLALEQAAAAQAQAATANASVANLTAQLAESEALLAEAEQRADALQASGNATQEELDQARLDVEAAQAALHAMQAQLSLADANASAAAANASEALDRVAELRVQLAGAQENATNARLAADTAQAALDAQAAAVADAQAEARRAQDAATLAMAMAAVVGAAAAGAVAFAVIRARRATARQK